MYDCIIVGAGPAGLLAATYLGRFRRRILIIHNERSRAALIPASHNYPGTIIGISGKKILWHLQRQAIKYGAEIKIETALSIEKKNNFKVITNLSNYQSNKLLIATGIADIEPVLPNLENAILKGLIRHCMICDAYELIDKNLAIIGTNEKAFKEALFLRTYTSKITLLTLGNDFKVSAEQIKKLKGLKIKVITDPIQKIKILKNKIQTITFFNDKTLPFDAIYSALGSIPHVKLLEGLGVKLKKDRVIVDKCQKTNVEGLYVAGDLAEGIGQISIAYGHAAIAATEIHNSLKMIRA